MNDGAAYLEKGAYKEAEGVYSQFLINSPDHPYVDDAAYRLAYMCVIADKRNPYFNYQNAEILFQNIIENYPNSRYINACQNWLNLLKIVNIDHGESSVSSIKDQLNSNEINKLRNELNRIKAENIKLKNTLDELEKAIER
jgi:tetratricopeptide (TPR) repeat protein